MCCKEQTSTSAKSKSRCRKHWYDGLLTQMLLGQMQEASECSKALHYREGTPNLAHPPKALHPNRKEDRRSYWLSRDAESRCLHEQRYRRCKPCLFPLMLCCRLSNLVFPPTQRNPTYRLYAVVSHSGSGPHSGHYYAHVRSGQNRWHEMNDSTVREVQVSQVLNQRNAYMLFYERTNRLGDAVGKGKMQGGPNGVAQMPQSSPTGNALGKRKDREDSDAAQPFPPQKVKYNHPTGPKTPYQQGRQGGPYQQPSPISPNRKQNHHHNGGGGQKKAENYFASKFNNNNRPRMVASMTGRPRK